MASVQQFQSVPSHMAIKSSHVKCTTLCPYAKSHGKCSLDGGGEEDSSWPTNLSNSIPSISHHRGKGHITPIMHNVVGGATTSGMPITGLFPDI